MWSRCALEQEVTRTQLQASFLSVRVVGISQDQDRDLSEGGAGPHRINQSQTIHPRQPNVEDYAVGLEPLSDRKGRDAVGCC